MILKAIRAENPGKDTLIGRESDLLPKKPRSTRTFCAPILSSRERPSEDKRPIHRHLHSRLVHGVRHPAAAPSGRDSAKHFFARSRKCPSATRIGSDLASGTERGGRGSSQAHEWWDSDGTPIDATRGSAPQRGKRQNAPGVCRGRFSQVDHTGLEPVTFSVSWRRASQLRQWSRGAEYSREAVVCKWCVGSDSAATRGGRGGAATLRREHLAEDPPIGARLPADTLPPDPRG